MKNKVKNKLKLELTTKSKVNFVVYLLDKNRTMVREDFIFYNNLKGAGVSLEKTKIENTPTDLSIINIDFNKLNDNVENILITSTNKIGNLTINTNESGSNFDTSFDISKEEYPHEIVLVKEYVKRDGNWYSANSCYKLYNHSFSKLVQSFYNGIVMNSQ